MTDFHFIRPEWFYAIVPLLILYALLLKHRLQSRSWQSFCDPDLLPHLFNQEQITQQKRPLFLLLLGGLICIIALAGPSWEKRPQPVFKKQSALVIVLDLSRSMDATDIKPSRLTRALHKIEDILNKRKEGQTALIVFADNAFTVTPLTEDNATISSQIKSLSSDIMPTQGSHADRAIAQAYRLFKQSSQPSGHIILITDGVSESTLAHIKKQRQSAYTISVLGVGTTEGSPIPLKNGGFFKDPQGGIVIPKLNTSRLQQLALAGAGSFRQLAANDSDITALLSPLNSFQSNTTGQSTELITDSWFETGPWLLLLIMPIAALAFRKGYLFVLLFFILPQPTPSYAFEWNQLWKNNNQQAYELLESDKAADAAKLFSDKKWKASADYKAGNFDNALKQFEQLDLTNVDNLYNLANTQAQLGQYNKALENYNKVIEQQPDHEDAKYNRDLLEKMQQEQKDNKQQGDNEQSEEDQQPSDQQNSSANNQKSDSQQNESESTEQNTEQAEQEDKQAENSKPDSAQDEQQKDKPDNNEDTAGIQDKDSAEQEESQTRQADNVPELSQEQQQANEQWLRRIPDDPGGLLRRKFQYQTQQRPQQNHGDQQW